MTRTPAASNRPPIRARTSVLRMMHADGSVGPWPNRIPMCCPPTENAQSGPAAASLLPEAPAAPPPGTFMSGVVDPFINRRYAPDANVAHADQSVPSEDPLMATAAFVAGSCSCATVCPAPLPLVSSCHRPTLTPPSGFALVTADCPEDSASAIAAAMGATARFPPLAIHRPSSCA